MTSSTIFATARRIIGVHCEGCANPCVLCRTMQQLLNGADGINGARFALQNAGHFADGINTSYVENAAQTLIDAINHELAVCIGIIREDALDEVLEASTITLANDASDRFAAMFPEYIAELNRRIMAHEV